MKATIIVTIIMWLLVLVCSAAIIYVSVNFPASELPEWFKTVFFSRV